MKPVTQFPVEISNEDAFASFKNVRNVTIKKVRGIYVKLIVNDKFFALKIKKISEI